jgi:hypothetical protein
MKCDWACISAVIQRWLRHFLALHSRYGPHSITLRQKAQTLQSQLNEYQIQTPG